MSTALNTDRYELTMLQAALQSGKAARQCVFEVFTRQLPAGRRYGVVAGTGRVLDAIQNFRFDEKELEYLSANSVVDAETLDWLANYKFSGNVSGYREGELYFGHSPILTVEGSFAEAVILETVILSILNYDSAVASAAARMKSVAAGRRLSEMGSRRAHEAAAVAAAHQLDAGVGQEVAQVQRNAGPAPSELGKNRRQPACRQRRQQRHGHAAALQGDGIAQGRYGGAHLGANAVGRFEKVHALGRQIHMPRAAVKQAQAQVALQRADEGAERGLRQVAQRGGAREAALLGQREEGVELAAGEVGGAHAGWV